jgi:hypothetical protein
VVRFCPVCNTLDGACGHQVLAYPPFDIAELLDIRPEQPEGATPKLAPTSAPEVRPGGVQTLEALRRECLRRGLPAGGNRGELEARLEANGDH